MFSRTFNLIPNFMMQICDLELKINYCHRTNSIISSKVYRCIYTTHISKAVSNSETLSSFGQIACLNTRVSLYWNWNATIAIHITCNYNLQWTLSALAWLILLCWHNNGHKNHKHPSSSPALYIHQLMYIPTFTLASCINYHFHKIPISCWNQSCHCHS